MSKIAVSMSVSGGNLSKKHAINVNLDFSGVDNTKILEWAADNRVIALQRVLRATNDEYIEKLKGKLEVHALECGGKIETPAERIAKLVAAGMPPALAKVAVENPTKFAELMAGLKS